MAYVQGGKQAGWKGVRGWTKIDEELVPDAWLVWDNAAPGGSCRVPSECTVGMEIWAMFSPGYNWASDGEIDWERRTGGDLKVDVMAHFEETSYGGKEMQLTLSNVVASRADWGDLTQTIRGRLELDPEGFWSTLLQEAKWQDSD
ncbi:MAG: hypothetical protein AAF481_00795 [Acidobacteriota bacterium]